MIIIVIYAQFFTLWLPQILYRFLFCLLKLKMYKLGLKRNLISLGFTVLIITMLLFSGPAKAIDVSLTTYDIDISTDSIKTFTLQVQINDGEFLPIWKTDIEFDNDGEIITCQIDSNNQVTGCDFLSVVSQDITNLDYGYGYGYGYDYGYGYQDFGYGYGYGYGTRGAIGGASYGVITYTLLINVAELPDSFTGNTIDATATVYGGNENDFESFKGSSSFDVTNNDQELVDNAKTSLTFNSIKGDNTNENQITENLNLVTINSDGVKISWASSDTSINTYNGQVTRPGYNEVNKEVTLTATLSKGTKSDTKEFILTVLKESKTDVDSVAQAKLDLTYDSILNGQDKDTVTTNLDLITEGSDGTTISWSSDNENTIGTDGSVSRAQLDKKVILTASISKNDASDTKEFSVIVIGTEDENELAVAQAKLDLTESLILNGNSAKDKIMGSLKLPTSLANHEDVSISWSSSNTAIVANDGSITRSNDEDKEITLTATLTKNSKSTTKVFSLIIKKNVAPPVLDDGKAEVNDGESEILIDNTNANDIKEINIPSSVDENELVSLNFKFIS